MQPRSVVLYIAMSLGGYIATEDHGLSFLSAVESPGEDYGYNEFIKTVDTVIMGRKTYDKVLTFGIAFPHRGRKSYVLSRSLTGRDENVEFYDGDIVDLIGSIRKNKGSNIFIDGGSELVFELMKRDLIDRFIISVIPTLLGGGIALFRSGRPSRSLRLTKTLSFPSGLVQLWYDRQ
ncbi:MAG: dihydrofolate reductase family protein [Ignavibacteria bacterium]|nr:dihydrofolate reductase family protein [Ignavibacteria bacterium]